MQLGKYLQHEGDSLSVVLIDASISFGTFLSLAGLLALFLLSVAST